MNIKDHSYNPKELMVTACSRLINDYENVFVGVGISLFAGVVAKNVHAPNITLLYEGGGIGANTKRMPWSISDNPITDNALVATELWRVLGDSQRGFINTAILGAAQVDKFGNLNSSVILGEGYTYQKPRVRMPGAGGANDLMTSCEKVIILMPLQKGKVVEKVDFITSPGFLSGPGDRERLGLEGGGPLAVVTDKCIFRFDESTKVIYLETIYPGVEVEEIKTKIGWDINVADNLKVAQPPNDKELKAMKILDPMEILTNSKDFMSEDFDDYYWKMKKSYETNEVLL